MKMTPEDFFGWAAVLAIVLVLYALWTPTGGIGQPCRREGTCDFENLKCVPIGFEFRCALRGD
jgi:hypothetical protein